MDETLGKLKNGSFLATTSLSLSCGLEDFPEEIFELADTLEILNLSNNNLSELPDDFGRLKKLRILFLSENNFTEVPKVLMECSNLTMIGFKSNKIVNFPEDALPLNTQWLILTDNQIERLPDSIGKLSKLQKCMLAGNKIVSLPKTMASCKNLELLRISANHLEKIPSWLFTLPKLSWLACAGNPFMNKHLLKETELHKVHWEDIELHEELGKGASGIISRATLLEEEEAFAIKVFKGEVTSDGYPIDEMQACIMAGEHDNLTTLHGRFHTHPEGKEGLIFSLIPPIYKTWVIHLILLPVHEIPMLRTENLLLVIYSVSLQILLLPLHIYTRKNMMHGDLYAHNILINDQAHALLSDFGASTYYKTIDNLENEAFERLEVRAFGCLLEDLLDRCMSTDTMSYKETITILRALEKECMSENVKQRPLFTEILKQLQTARF